MGGGAATLGEQQVVGEKPATKILINRNFPTSQKNQSKHQLVSLKFPQADSF